VLEGKHVRRTLKLNGQPLSPTPANLKHAHRLAAEIRGKIKHGVFVMADYFPDEATPATEVLTLSVQLDRWLKTLRMEESTLAGYTSAVKFWKTVLRAQDSTQPLGTVVLRQLRLSQLLLALATRPNLSGKTVNNYVSVLRAALQLAVEDKVLKDNPADKIPRAAWQREPPDPFSRDELEAICADMRDHFPEPIWNFVEWWGFSGPRPSEAVALKWEHVDLERGEMIIREAMVRGVEKETTKTNVIRTVRLNSRALGPAAPAEAYARRWRPCLAGSALRETVEGRESVPTQLLDAKPEAPWHSLSVAEKLAAHVRHDAVDGEAHPGLVCGPAGAQRGNVPADLLEVD